MSERDRLANEADSCGGCVVADLHPCNVCVGGDQRVVLLDDWSPHPLFQHGLPLCGDECAACITDSEHSHIARCVATGREVVLARSGCLPFVERLVKGVGGVQGAKDVVAGIASGVKTPCRPGGNQWTEKLRRGLVVLLTGLPGAGKTTIARGAAEALKATTRIGVVDGDVVRADRNHHDFSVEGRWQQAQRLMASAVNSLTDGADVMLVAAVMPYRSHRREMSKFIVCAGHDCRLVHVSTPTWICEDRDPKGLWAEARAGRIQRFTGVSDPYEPPLAGTQRLQTAGRTAAECVAELVDLVQDWLTEVQSAGNRKDGPA